MVVGAYEAKTHLPQLLERVARGERIVIAKHGMPIAELVPVQSRSQSDRRQAIEKMKAFRAKRTLAGGLQEMIDEGRQ